MHCLIKNCPDYRSLVSTQVLSLPARNEWGESRREGRLNITTSSPRPSPPSCVRRRGREPFEIRAAPGLGRYQCYPLEVRESWRKPLRVRPDVILATLRVRRIPTNRIGLPLDCARIAPRSAGILLCSH